MWVVADAHRIGSPELQRECARRTNELRVPPLDAYLEEEERFP
jgi:hypothetical protein